MGQMVDLQSFVAEALRQIVRGVHDANEQILEFGAGAGGQRANEVHFDVAVTATQEAKDHTGIGVLVAAFGAGTTTESIDQAETVTRIRFTVPLWFDKRPPITATNHRRE